jgi:branched-chain amino acid transport system permease protein
MDELMTAFRKNRTQVITLAVLALLFLIAVRGMDTEDWVITMLRGLSVGAVTFLVAAGFSLIFGLMDVLNLAHGTLFMIGAYIGWTVYVRPDTAVDVITPGALLIAGLLLAPLWHYLLERVSVPAKAARAWPWVVLALAVLVLVLTIPRFPIASWDPGDYSQSPITYAGLMDRGDLVVPEAGEFSGVPPAVAFVGVLLGGALLSLGIAGLARSRQAGSLGSGTLPKGTLAVALLIALLGIVVFFFNDALTAGLLGMDTTWRFVIAILVASLVGAGLGALMEATVIRPLYVRPMYQLLLTLGVSFMGIEIARSIWGRPEFTMPKPSIFRGTGDGCPATSLSDWLTYKCSTISFMGSRVRVYNEIFIILVGLIVLVAVWLLLQRSRLGMTIRAGVQDSEMVQALGINVRRVFMLVFALGVGLAAFGGVLAGPSMGLSNAMGEVLLLNALIALAIGGLTSYPGAAAGSLLVGLLQQFIIKYGQIGINLPFLAEPFKPTPPLVPASTVLLMVIILLVMPQGLFGRKE